MKILLTGAKGLVGRAVRQACSGHELIALGRGELDVTDKEAVDRAFYEHAPQAVLHCAAYTDVDAAENDADEATRVNAGGAGCVARAAATAGAAMLYVSSDYVFDGEADRLYVEEDRTQPLSAYGRSKLAGERRTLEESPDGHIIVRTGWVYGKSKGFVDWAQAEIERGKPLRLVADQWGSPTSADELARAMLTLLEGEHRGVFHFANKGVTNWLELGERVANELGVEAVIEPIGRDELSRLAPRPEYSALSVSRYEQATGCTVATYQEVLKKYLTHS